MEGVEREESVGLVRVDVRVRVENACVRVDCGCWMREDGFEDVGRRRMVVNALFRGLVEESGVEGDELTVDWEHDVCGLERACSRKSI